MLYVLHAEQPEPPLDRHPVARQEYKGDVPWATFAGRTASSVRATRERMRRDLRAIKGAGLVVTDPTAPPGSPAITFLDEVGDGTPFAFTDSATFDSIVLPSGFFTKGWNLVLTDDEIFLWLCINDTYKQRHHQRAGFAEDGVPMTQHFRYQSYGVSGESYSALHELEEFGLIEVHDPMPTRSKGKFEPPTPEQRETYEAEGHAFSPVPYQLKPAKDPFAKSAVYVVAEKLADELPPRMMDVDPILTMLKTENVRQVR